MAESVKAYASFKHSPVEVTGAGSNPVPGVIFPISFHCNISCSVLVCSFDCTRVFTRASIILELCPCIVNTVFRMFLNVICGENKDTTVSIFITFLSVSQFRLIIHL